MHSMAAAARANGAIEGHDTQPVASERPPQSDFSEMPRGGVADTLTSRDRQARCVASALLERGVVVSATAHAPPRLAFPAALASRWMSGLFPERAS